MDYRITQPVMDSVMRGTLDNEVYLDGKSFAYGKRSIRFHNAALE